MLLLSALAVLQSVPDLYALPSLAGLPANIVWGMSRADVITVGGGSIHGPAIKSVDTLLPTPR